MPLVYSYSILKERVWDTLQIWRGQWPLDVTHAKGFTLDQYDKISSHTHQGLQFLDNFNQFIKDRSSIETDYAAKLRKLVKNYQPKKKDDEDNSYSSYKAFSMMLNETSDIAGQHELISENLLGIIAKDISTLVKELKDERKKLLSEGSKLQASLQNSCAALDKSKKHYEKMFKEAEKSEEAFNRADNDLHLSRAEVEKARQTKQQRNQVSEDAKTDYANQLQKTNNLQREHYNELMPRVFDQLQRMDERRSGCIQAYMKRTAEIHRQVLPIITKCLDGIVLAADSIDPTKDAEIVIERYKSGYAPPDDFPFEDLSSMRSCETGSTTSSMTPSYRGDTIRGTISGGKKKRSGLLGIFTSNKNNIEELKDDYSDLPPNQRRKKLVQEVDKIRTEINTVTGTREGLMKLKMSYEKNPALGDPNSLTGEITNNTQKLEKLQTELEKYQNYLTEVDSQKVTPDTQKRYRNSLSEGSLSRSASESSVTNNHQNNNKVLAPGTPLTTHNAPENHLGSNYSAIGDEDDFEENGYEGEPYEAELLPALGTAIAMYPFDAQSEGSIPMGEREEFLVVEVDQGDGWTRVRRDNTEEGFVPTSYLEVTMYK
ncbi:formin-binding protein 1-like isoform X2 [Ornithodoros turicata]